MNYLLKIKKRLKTLSSPYIVLMQILHQLFYRKKLNERVIQFLNEEKLMSYLNKYDYIWKNTKTSNRLGESFSEDIIWTMWLQGEEEAPRLVKNCIMSIRKYTTNYKLVVLDDKNIEKYITVPGYIKSKREQGYISNTHYSDIIRLMILSKYGGCWIDSTVYLTELDNKESEILSIKKVLDQDFFMIKAPLTLNQFRISSSWLIRIKKSNPIINTVEKLLLEYWKYEYKIRAYFLIHLCFTKVVLENDDFKKIWDDIPYFDDSQSNYLRTKFSKKYSEKEWNQIRKMVSIHKLNWKLCKEGGEDFGGEGTFCEAFLNNRLE